MTTVVFKVIGMPFLRRGFTFSLPGIDIEIAKECSGIRSSLSLLLSAIVVGYLFLRSAWSQLFLAVVTIPIVIFKNAVRIAIISWLGIYVDRSFFFGNLHRRWWTCILADRNRSDGTRALVLVPRLNDRK